MVVLTSKVNITLMDLHPYEMAYDNLVPLLEYRPILCPNCGSPHQTAYLKALGLNGERNLLSGDLFMDYIEIRTCLNCGNIIPRLIQSGRQA
jgi:hypothetical protein